MWSNALRKELADSTAVVCAMPVLTGVERFTKIQDPILLKVHRSTAGAS